MFMKLITYDNLRTFANLVKQMLADLANALNSLPDGGTTGQTLIKQSASDGDASWGYLQTIDLSSDTVAASSLLEGVTAHDANGDPVIGTVPNGELLRF